MSGEKTEQPTDKKKKDAKEKGQVAVSKDIQTIAKLFFFYIIFFWLSSSYDDKLSKLLDLIITKFNHSRFTLDSTVFYESLWVLNEIILPLIAICVIIGLVFTWIQTGFIVSAEAATPSFKKLDAVETIKSMFSKKSLVQLLLSVLKVIILSTVGYFIFLFELNDILYSYRVGLNQTIQVLIEIIKDIVYISLGIFLIIAVIDWAAVYFHHINSLKMSIQDIKDEQKQVYGNPLIKQQQRREQRNILNSSLNRISEAKAVVANPMHIAVALDYEPGKHDIPYVLAIAEDEEALLLRTVAKKKGIPVIVNVKLAGMLYTDCLEDEYIQKQHLELAAEVFRAIIQLSQQSQDEKQKDHIIK